MNLRERKAAVVVVAHRLGGLSWRALDPWEIHPRPGRGINF